MLLKLALMVNNGCLLIYSQLISHQLELQILIQSNYFSICPDVKRQLQSGILSTEKQIKLFKSAK